jgi:hypothetical protein
MPKCKLLRSVINAVILSESRLPTIPPDDLKKNWIALNGSGIHFKDEVYDGILRRINDNWKNFGVPPMLDVLIKEIEETGKEDAIAAIRLITSAIPCHGDDFDSLILKVFEENKLNEFKDILGKAWKIASEDGKGIRKAFVGLMDFIQNNAESPTVIDVVEESKTQDIVEDLIKSSSVILFWGSRNTGKSSIGLDIIRHICEERDWCGLTCHRVPILYLSEMSSSDLAITAKGIGFDLNNKIKIHLRRDGDVDLATSNGRLSLESMIFDHARGGVVFIDTISSFCTFSSQGEAAAAKGLIRFLSKAADDYKCSIVMVHHSRKESDDKRAKTKWRNEDAFSGSSIWGDHSDRVFSLSPVYDDDNERIKGRGRIRFDKMRGNQSYPYMYTIGESTIEYKADSEYLIRNSFIPTETERKILSCIETGQINTTNSIAVSIGKTPQTVRNAIKKMVDMKKITAVGSPNDPNRYYKINDDLIANEIPLDVAE